jgi:hypothetical protein
MQKIVIKAAPRAPIIFPNNPATIEPNNGNIEQILGDVEKGSYYDEDCELWQPKEGEWCWYKRQLCKVLDYNIPLMSGNATYYYVRLLSFDTDRDGDRCTYRCSMKDVPFVCEPFIGELPTFIKDK